MNKLLPSSPVKARIIEETLEKKRNDKYTFSHSNKQLEEIIT